MTGIEDSLKTGESEMDEVSDLLHLCNLEAAVGEIRDDPLHVFSG